MRYRLAGAYDSNVALLLATGGEPARELGALGRDPAPHHAPRHRPRDQPGVPLRPAHLVPRAATRGRSRPPSSSCPTSPSSASWRRRRSRSTSTTRSSASLARRRAAPRRHTVEATRRVLELKETLLERPMQILVEEPHYLSAWLSRHHRDFALEADRVVWQRNPVEMLAETYRLLHLDTPSAAAAHRIWDHDRDQLEHGARFLRALGRAAPRGSAGPSSTTRCARSVRRSDSTTPPGRASARRTPAISSGSTSSCCCR